ncbi:MAG: hypothetical protein ACR2IJ_06930 [Fluviibacter sp.]
MLDLIFLVFVIFIIVVVATAWRFTSRRAYSYLLVASAMLSGAMIVFFSKYEIAATGNSPLHAALLSFGQYGALTLSAKIWFGLNYAAFNRVGKFLANLIVHGTLLLVIAANYWFKTQSAELLILLYPLASISLVLIAEEVEEALHKKEHGRR